MESFGITDQCPGNLQALDANLFMTLLNALMLSKCKLNVKEAYPENSAPELSDGDEFDFIVIGSGSGGAAVANKLSDNKNSTVLVLEAGDYPSATSDIPGLVFSTQRTYEDWQYHTQPSNTSCLGNKGRMCRWPRGKVLGGSSSINAMLYIKGNNRDYDHWAELGNDGWDWEGVKDYFKEIENLDPSIQSENFGRDGLLDLTKYDSGEPIKYALHEAYRELGYPILSEENPEKPLGILDTYNTIKNGIRVNAAKAFLGKIRHRTNLVLSINSFVQKILVDADTKTAYGVEAKIGERVLHLKAKKEVILSGGTINSPQLLMLSGIGPKDHLESLGIQLVKNLPVGRHLEDHILVEITAKVNPDAALYPHPLDNIYNYFIHNTGILSTVHLINTLTFINTKNDSRYPNVGFHHVLYPQNDIYMISTIGRIYEVDDRIIADRLEAIKTNALFSLAVTLLNPKSKGRVLLNSTDPHDPPIIHSGYLTIEDDIETMVEGVRFAEAIYKTDPMRKFDPKLLKLTLPACDGYQYDSDEYWKCVIRHQAATVYHLSGTCRMGPVDDGTAVVDSRLRVHGVRNLRVVDASVFPKIPSANTQAAAMMVGRKAAAMIAEDWGLNSGKTHDEL
ncbi:unnamed protein product [Phyllotreta striolata]|uniref:Glucose-methanol-choline oxidoreductase N-terminal domain-containing protein n=1 Tax=Phyllotreta striolata TaxID=444603 RepID=A0A9P0GRM2_PHYSR|nr:unnamed protein product [Phyllotreta striolata]